MLFLFFVCWNPCWESLAQYYGPSHKRRVWLKCNNCLDILFRDCWCKMHCPSWESNDLNSAMEFKPSSPECMWDIYINSSHSKKLQHQFGVFCKKLSPLSEKNTLVMLYEKEINLFYICVCKTHRGNCRTAQKKTLYNEGTVYSNLMFSSSPSINRDILVCVGLDRCFEDLTLRMRDLHDLHAI